MTEVSEKAIATAAARASRVAQAEANISRIVARSETLVFKDLRLAADHFARHAREFGFRTVDEYVGGARALAKRAETDESVLVKARKGGDMLYYDPAAKRFRQWVCKCSGGDLIWRGPGSESVDVPDTHVDVPEKFRSL